MLRSRVEMYGMHRGLRRMLYETALEIGATDFRSDDASNHMLDQVALVCEFLTEHAETEDEYFHPALEERAPGASSVQAEEHEKLEDAQTAIEGTVRAMRQAESGGELN